jgi:DNA polymerase
MSPTPFSIAWSDCSVDAREQLRRYLEQRREMGETELVLDGLTVDDALRLLGARGGAVSDAGIPANKERPQPREAPVTDDWRAALRATGAAPPTEKEPDAPRTVPASRKPDDVERAVAKSSDQAGPTLAGGESAELIGSLDALATLDAVAKHVASCTRCPLYSTATNPVPGEGNPNADFMCVGEAPGATEDETGRPFIGAAGQLLTKILGAIDLKREDVFICNVLKHRPPGNRNPRPEEVSACGPYLIRQIELIKPKVILALGTFAAQTLLDTKLSIGKLRGQVHRYHGVPLIVTYHPAALLRNPGWKRPTWEDVQLARRILDSAPPASPG